MTRQLYIRPDVFPILERCGLDNFDALMNPPVGEALDKPGLEPGRRRYRITLGGPSDEPNVFYLKCYEKTSTARGWRGRFGPNAEPDGPAAREVACMDELNRAGISALRWAAWGRRTHNKREQQSFVLTEAAPGISIERWLPDVFAGLAPDRQAQLKPRVLAELARLVQTLHQAGYVHRDLYLSHVFIDAGHGLDVRLTLIDLRRVFRPRRMVRRWRVKDLAQLHYSTPHWFASPQDRMEWLRAYLDTDRLNGRHERMVSSIVHKAKRIARHDRRRARRPTP